MAIWKRVPIWDEWRATTRFLKSAGLAMVEEAKRWRVLPVKTGTGLVLECDNGTGTYTVDAAEHVATLQSPRLLCGMPLMYSYALVEDHARSIRAALRGNETLDGGVEVWASNLLRGVSRDWANVKDGTGGVVEASIVRNAFAHGTSSYEASTLNRYENVCKPAPWSVGDPITLDHARLEELRARLRSRARVLADGMTEWEKAHP